MVVYYGHERRGGLPILAFVGVTAVFALVLLGFPQTSFGSTGTANTPLFFSYDPYAFNGPSYWYRLNMEGNQCGGSRNSPIIIETTDSCEENEKGGYSFQSGSCSIGDLVYELNNIGPKATFSNGCADNTMTMPGDEAVYKAIQMHIHLGSEHRIDGVTLDAELHVVHQESGGYWHAVLAVLLQASEAVEDHAVFGQWLDKWEAARAGVLEVCNSSKNSGEQRRMTRLLEDNNDDDEASFDLYNDLVPSGSSYYQYFGSLTIPPCSEDVFWSVADIPLTISPSQLERLASITLSYIDPELCLPATSASSKTNTTNRPPQSLNGRSVQKVCPGE